MTGPCGADFSSGKPVALTVPGPYTTVPLKFNLQLEQADNDAQVTVYGSLNPNDFSNAVQLYKSAAHLSPSNINLPVDFTNFPGLNGNTKVTIQIRQLGSDSPDLKYICTDVTVQGPTKPNPPPPAQKSDPVTPPSNGGGNGN
ncbi:hypothetical protein HDV06_001839, partial [Boothiomyces sp. JEL0866]